MLIRMGFTDPKILKIVTLVCIDRAFGKRIFRYLSIMKSAHWLTFFILLAGCSVQAQVRTLSGMVTDSLSGDVLPGTTVWISETRQGAVCDSWGFFILHPLQKEIRLQFRHLGYEPLDTTIRISGERSLHIKLLPSDIRIQPAEIRGAPSALEMRSTRPGQIRLSAAGVEKTPAILSEPDPLGSIRYLPGVQSVAEGDGYLYIRGGSADQNLVLLDGGVIYNPAHLFGVFSVVNPSVIRSVNLYKSAIPATYGNRLASVVDVQTRAPDMRSTRAELTTGILLSRLTLETPLVPEKLSLLAAARRSQLDWIARPFINNTSLSGSGYYFGDLNLRLNWTLRDDNRLSLTWYSGTDRGQLADTDFALQAGIAWGNRLLGITHWYRLNPRQVLITSAHLSQYFMHLNFLQHPYRIGVDTGMKGLKIRSEWQYYASPKSRWVTGLSLEELQFRPYRAGVETPGSASTFGSTAAVYTFQATAFAHYQLTPSPRWRLEAGFRLPFYWHHGPYTRYEPGIPGQHAIDSTCFAPGESVSAHLLPEPRLTAAFDLSSQTTLKAALSRHSQSIHMVPISTATLPADIWTPATSRTPPQTGTNVSLGIFHAFPDRPWEVHAEAYYRSMQNQVEFMEGISTLDLLKYNLDMQMTTGRGEARGVECMLRKKEGRITGWLSYTWSVTTRQFDDINGGKFFYPKHDRRHDLSLLISWQASKYADLSLNYIFATGQAVSLPGSFYYFDGKVVNHYGERNNFRMPPYHRLDFAAKIYPKKKRKIQSYWTFSIYNLYNRMNPFFIYFDTQWINEQGEFGTRGRSLALLPFVPSFSWTGRF